MRDLHKEPGPAVAAAIELLQQRDHRVVVVGADAVQRRIVDQVVNIDGGVTLPVQAGQIGEAEGGEDHHGVDSPGLQNGVEPAEAEAGRADFKAINLEGERARALRDAGQDALIVANRMRRSGPVRDLDRRQHPAELLAARAAQQRHHGAGQRIALVAGRLGRSADPFGRLGIDARGAAQRIGNGCAGKPQRAGQGAQGRGGHRSQKYPPWRHQVQLQTLTVRISGSKSAADANGALYQTVIPTAQRHCRRVRSSWSGPGVLF